MGRGEELPKRAQALPGMRIRIRCFFHLQQALLQHGNRRVDLTPFSFVHNHSEHLPDIGHCLEVIASITDHVAYLHKSPGLELLEADTDIGAGHRQGVGDLLRVQRLRRNVEQSVNLRYGPADPPAGPHLTPMENELFVY